METEPAIDLAVFLLQMGRTKKEKDLASEIFSPKIVLGVPYSLTVSPANTQFSLNTFCVKIATQLLLNIKIDVPKAVNLLSKNSLHLFFLF